MYLEDVETREDAGTPPILQQIRAALALWVKEELVGVDLIQRREQWLIRTAIARLQANPCVEVLGNIQVARCPILSLVVHAKQADKDADGDGDAWQDSTDWRGTDGGGHDKLKARVGKPLHCRFVAKLLNDLFGVQVRAGCACAGPYAHALLGIDRERSLAVRDALIQVRPKFCNLAIVARLCQDCLLPRLKLLALIKSPSSSSSTFFPLGEVLASSASRRHVCLSWKVASKRLMLACNKFASGSKVGLETHL